MKYRLRTLLIGVTAFVIWLGWEAERMHRQRQANAVIYRVGGIVEYEDAFSRQVTKHIAKWLGRDAVENIMAVYLGGSAVKDDDLACLQLLPRVREVVLTSSDVSDAGLPHLYRLSKLETVDVRFTKVTDAGVERLRRALPHARILHKSDLE